MFPALDDPHRTRFHTVVDDAWLGPEGCRLSGRLTHARLAPAEEAGRLRSLRRNTRMLLTAGSRGRVTVQLAGERWTVDADQRGYWEQVVRPAGLTPGWHELAADPCASSAASLFVCDPRNRHGIISDIDDTILVTHVLSKRALLANSLTLPAEKRLCVDGMPALYRGLAAKNPAPETTAIFYLSSAPRQLTDNLRRFLHSHGFPRGVLQLRRIVSKRHEPERDHTAYKCERIEAILRSHPDVRFTLFGDDGETDPEVYAAIRSKHPDQIADTFIRRVNPDSARRRYPEQRDLGEAGAYGG